MATKSPVKDSASDHSNGNPLPAKPISPSPIPVPPVKLETPPSTSDSKQTAIPTPTPSISDAAITHIPSYSRWFSWSNIHECEVRFLPEFFDFRSPSKNPKVYKYLRNSIVKNFRDNPSRKITFTDVRKRLVGDVGSTRRVFDFLEAWGLINYSPSAPNKSLKWDDKETKSVSQSDEGGGASADSSAPNREVSKRVCSGCKSNCSIACFACDKYDLTLCARCYVRGNYRVGVSSSDFRRVEINEQNRTNWTDKETLHLLEAVMHYGDDWRKVAQHVGGRSEKECVTHFVKLPFGEQLFAYPETGKIDKKDNPAKENGDADNELMPSKRIRLTPLADASNPIMAQAAFLSAVVGVKVAEAAARAAVTKLYEVDYEAGRGSAMSVGMNVEETGADDGSNGDTNLSAVEGAFVDANSQIKREELDVERAISAITDVQMKKIKEHIDRFEELDLKREKEWRQLEQMKSTLFVDQLALLFHRNVPKTGENIEDNNTNTRTD